jgi:hypothetical protein
MGRTPESVQPPQASASTNSATRAVLSVTDGVSQENDTSSSGDGVGIKLPAPEIRESGQDTSARNQNQEVHSERPAWPAPKRGRRYRDWGECQQCRLWFAADRDKLKTGERRFCSNACFRTNAVEAKRFAGESNPRWLGGVSNDNMRYRNRQKKREPVKEAARREVQEALRRGLLVRRSCEQCGAEKGHAHHDDYSRPLDVRWLCRPCHTAHHAAERRRAG